MYLFFESTRLSWLKQRICTLITRTSLTQKREVTIGLQGSSTLVRLLALSRMTCTQMRTSGEWEILLLTCAKRCTRGNAFLSRNHKTLQVWCWAPEVGGWGRSPSIWGVGGAFPRKQLRFQALKSAFWWILEMVLLWIIVKAKNPSGLIGGSGYILIKNKYIPLILEYHLCLEFR